MKSYDVWYIFEGMKIRVRVSALTAGKALDTVTAMLRPGAQVYKIRSAEG